MRRLLTLAVLVALAAACGERDGTDVSPPPSPTPPAPAQPEPAPAEPSEVAPAEAPAPAPPEAPATTVAGAGEPGATDTEASPEEPADPAELEAIVRAWSEALNAGDNEAAADLFAPGAIIVQGGVAFQFETLAQLVNWHQDLPCSGEIVEVVVRGNIVGAVFELGDRATSACDAPVGTLAAALFAIEDGLITVWQQVTPEEVRGEAPPPDLAEPGAPPAGTAPEPSDPPAAPDPAEPVA